MGPDPAIFLLKRFPGKRRYPVYPGHAGICEVSWFPCFVFGFIYSHNGIIPKFGKFIFQVWILLEHSTSRIPGISRAISCKIRGYEKLGIPIGFGSIIFTAVGPFKIFHSRISESLRSWSIKSPRNKYPCLPIFRLLDQVRFENSCVHENNEPHYL